RGVKPRYAPTVWADRKRVGSSMVWRNANAGHDADAGYAHESPCRFVCLCFLADTLVESGLLLFDLLVHREQAIDDGPQHVLIEQSAYMIAELSADRMREQQADL